MIPIQKRFFKPGKESRMLSILDGIHGRARISQQEMGHKAALSGAMVNKYVKTLHQGGLITLTPVNGKSFSYGLTQEGESQRRAMLGQFCAEIVQVYSALKESIREKLAGLLDQGLTQVALFGAAETCQVVLAALEDTPFRVVAIIDNDPSKHGQAFRGHRVVSPSLLPTIPCQAVIISSFGRQDEIYGQLTAPAAARNLQIVRL